MIYIKHLSHLFPDIEATLVNTSGRKLLTVCSSYRLESANGQIPGDKRGNFTCFNYRAASVADYLVLGMSLMKNIMKFKVLPPNFDSKHVPITATFNSSFVKFGKAKVVNHPNICKWDNQSAILFHSY